MDSPTLLGKASSSTASSSKSRKGDWQIRKKTLEDDPWALDIDSRAVTCRACLRRIKLSEKSTYDTYHWGVHKKRCKTINPPTPSKQKSSIRSVKSRSKSKLKTSPRIARKIPTSTHVYPDFISSPTPPLTPDASGDEDMTSPEHNPMKRASSELSPPPSSERPSEEPPVIVYGKWSEEIGDYFTRMHGAIKQTSPADLLVTSWHDWSWSQLHEPEFSESSLAMTP